MKVVKYIIPFIFPVCLLMAKVPVWSQVGKPVNTQTKIILPDRPVRFDSLTNIISRQANVGFSINTSRIAPYQVLLLQPGEQTLEIFLAQLSAKTGIRFKLIGSHIVLFDKKPVNSNKKNTAAATTVSVTRGTSITDPPAAASKQKQERLALPDGKRSGNKSTALKKSGIKKSSAASLLSVTRKSNTAQAVSEEKIAADHIPAQPKQKYTSQTQAGFIVTSGNTSRLKKLATLLNDTGRLKKTIARAPAGTVPDTTTPSSAKTRKKKPKKEANGSLSYAIGGGIAYTQGINNALNKNKYGWEFNIKVGKFVSSKFELGLSAGYNKFSGDYYSDNVFDDSVIERVALIPVLAGVRYYPLKQLYISFEGGYAFPAYKDMLGSAAIAPAIGTAYPLRNGNRLDFGLRCTFIAYRPQILESSTLTGGGYSFLTARLSYGFGNSSYKKRSRKQAS